MRQLFKKMIKNLMNNVFMNFLVLALLNFNQKNKVLLLLILLVKAILVE